MKEYLPFLIAFAIAGFRLYSNFQKEQEKARKRNPSRPAGEETGSPVAPVKKADTSGPKTDIPNHIPETAWQKQPYPKPETRPKPELVEESYDSRRPYEPVYKREYKEPVYEKQKPVKSVFSEKKIPQRVELTHNFEDVSDETRKNRSIHQSHRHGSGSIIHEDQEGAYEFDMRDAVIKEAILNRPKY